MLRFPSLLALLCLCAATALPAAAQSPEVVESPRVRGQREQARFENVRRANLPYSRTQGASRCEEVVGRFCYWYDEDAPPPPPERAEVTRARTRLIELLDSLATVAPSDTWLSGQLVRYLDEAGRGEEALERAQSCRAFGWWCDALEGFALHQLGRFADAEQSWNRLLAQLPPGQQCRWQDLGLYLDTDTRRQYQRHSCGTPQREAFEAKAWLLARPRFSQRGNDARSEHFARQTYVEFLREAASAYAFGFDEDERELVLRFGWSRAWSRGPDQPTALGSSSASTFSVTGHDPVPAYRYFPPFHVLSNPTVSDSTDWAVQLPPVVARYQPPYAKRLVMLEHQQGLFRRGDSALVVLAYDVGDVPAMAGARIEAALAVAAGAETVIRDTVQRDAGMRGTLAVTAPWAPLLMSAEIAAADSSVLARARYGIRPPYAIGTRVSLSDLLFYKPAGELPTRVEDALPLALATQRVLAAEKLGIFWEAYNTNPAGEQMTISLTVVPETEQAGLFRRGLRALRLARESAPVSITVQDVSARNASRTGRAVELDISTLRKGDYLVQLEVSVAGQYTLRTDRRLTVIDP